MGTSNNIVALRCKATKNKETTILGTFIIDLDEKDINIVLEVYVDNELIDTMDEFVESEPQEFSEELFDAKNIELRVKSDIYTSRRLYIHNGRFKKVKEDE